MEADRQVTTVFTVQPSFHHRHSTNRVSWSVTNVQSHLNSSFADDGDASWYSVCRVLMVEWRLDCENVVTWRSLTSMLAAPGGKAVDSGAKDPAFNPHFSRSSHTGDLYAWDWLEWPGARKENGYGATRGVTVGTSAFLACHQYYCASSSLAWGLNLRALVCGIFWSSSSGVFSGYSGSLPSFIG